MRTDNSVTFQLSTDRLLGDYPDAPGPRFLKPRQQLRRLRPVRLGVVSTTLRGTFRQARGMQLIERHFPEALPHFDLADDWDDTLRELLRCVERARWFAVNWEGLDFLHRWWMEEGDEDDNPDLEHSAITDMAQFLDCIPVHYFGFGEEAWLNEVAEEWPILCLIRGLVDPTYTANISDLRVEYDIWDNDLGPYFDPQAFSVPPYTDPPLCWLPDVVRFCARVTGNDLLDTGVDTIWDFDWSAYRWDRPQDIEALKLLYPPALRAWGRIEGFLKWCKGPEEVGQVIALLFADTPADGTQARETEDNDEER
jgi:hypothetical protein